MPVSLITNATVDAAPTSGAPSSTNAFRSARRTMTAGAHHAAPSAGAVLKLFAMEERTMATCAATRTNVSARIVTKMILH